jgi:tripartite-type tricarboxylate transporter receptor subunit TctC
LAAELFKQAAGVDIVHVPYRGTGAAMPDLIAGRVAMMIDGVPIQAKNIEGGTVRALAVTTNTRSPALPNVPTMKEEGLDYEVPFWTALYAPAKTPAAVVAKLAAAAHAATRDSDTAKRLADVGTESVGSDPVELDRLTRDQYSLYGKLVQENKSLVPQ